MNEGLESCRTLCALHRETASVGQVAQPEVFFGLDVSTEETS